jgi:hypothetical protein
MVSLVLTAKRKYDRELVLNNRVADVGVPADNVMSYVVKPPLEPLFKSKSKVGNI